MNNEQNIYDMASDKVVQRATVQAPAANPKSKSRGCKIGCIIFLVVSAVIGLIIGVLAAIALPQYMTAVEKSRAAEGMTLLSTIADSQEMHRLATADNTYADTFDELNLSFKDVNGADATGDSYWTKNFYIEIIPAQAGSYVKAERKYSESDQTAYTITRTFRDGKVTCVDGHLKGICQTLGLKGK